MNYKGLIPDFIYYLRRLKHERFNGIINQWLNWEIGSPRTRCNLIWDFKEKQKEK
jgi:hypothetical protein